MTVTSSYCQMCSCQLFLFFLFPSAWATSVSNLQLKTCQEFLSTSEVFLLCILLFYVCHVTAQDNQEQSKIARKGAVIYKFGSRNLLLVQLIRKGKWRENPFQRANSKTSCFSIAYQEYCSHALKINFFYCFLGKHSLILTKGAYWYARFIWNSIFTHSPSMFLLSLWELWSAAVANSKVNKVAILTSWYLILTVFQWHLVLLEVNLLNISPICL